MMRREYAQPGLHWDDCDGFGFLSVDPSVVCTYGQAYWDKYVAMAQTECGRALTAARTALVQRCVDAVGSLCDIGIGSGQFLQGLRGAMTRPRGYDVNPVAVRWLRAEGLWGDPLRERFQVLTFWDSLEHIIDPIPFLKLPDPDMVFCSLPIFRDVGHASCSKHFRPGEHWWYFTAPGLVRWFEDLGFVLVESNRMEEALGREDIGTFAFRRRDVR